MSLAFVGKKITDHLVQMEQRSLAQGLEQSGSDYFLPMVEEFELLMALVEWLLLVVAGQGRADH